MRGGWERLVPDANPILSFSLAKKFLEVDIVVDELERAILKTSSFNIPVYNKEAIIRRLLKAVLELKLMDDILKEIIVDDTCPTD